MIKLICVDCGNFTFFETDVEGLKGVEPNEEGIIIKDSFVENWNYTDETIRGNLTDIIDYVLKQPDDTIRFDHESNKYYNIYITCARCGSRIVTIPSSEWNPTQELLPLDDELLENRKDYLQLRKERSYENNLPVLWKP